MQTVRIPFVGSYNQRGLAGSADLTANLDQRYLNCTFDVVRNPITDKLTLYVQRRPGWSTDSLVAAGSASTGCIHPQSFNATLSAFGETNSVIYYGQSSVGTITGRALHFTETIVGGVSYVMLKSSDGTGWYYADGAKDTTAYTMDGNNSTTVTDLKVGGVSSVSGLYSGQKLTAATNIPAGTRIVSVNAGAFTAVLDTATTGGAFNDLAVTKEPIAKILDADFNTSGTAISAFVEMDGYLFYTTDNGNIWNSDLNSVTSFAATSFVNPNMAPDPPVAIARSQNAVIVFGSGSKEVFQNAGLATGSPLQRVPQYFERIGCLDQRSVTTIENTIYFVSTPFEGDVGVFALDGLKATRVSTPAIDRIIGTVGTGDAVYAASFRLGGYPYAAFSLSSAADGPASMRLLESGDFRLLEDGVSYRLLEDTPGQTASFIRMMVYNSFLKVWSEWDCNQATFIDGISSGTANQLIATSRMNTSGKVYTISPTSNGEVWQDDGTTFPCEVRTARVDMGTGKRKFIHGMRLISDQQTAGTVSMYFSDDNYATWKGPFVFNLNEARPQVQRLGSHWAGRAYKFIHQYNGPFRAEAFEIDFSVEE